MPITLRNTLFAAGAALLVLSCSNVPKITQTEYVDLMTDIGCHQLSETDAKAEEILSKHKITRGDIMDFRQKAGKQVMDAATIIAENVAKCHGVK